MHYCCRVLMRIFNLSWVLIISSRYLAEACPGSFYNGTHWYFLLTKSAMIKPTPLVPFTASTLYNHVASDITFPQNSILNSNINPVATPCGLCALRYANNLLNLRTSCSVDSSCLQAAGSWSVVDTVDILSTACTSSIEDAIAIFDGCSDVTYSLLTGMPVSTQCSFEDFLNIDAPYHSYGLMMHAALNLTDQVPPEMHAFLETLATSTCGVCFTNFMSSISAASTNSDVRGYCKNDPDAIYSSSCRSSYPVREALSRLHNCVGGYDLTNLNSAPPICSIDEKLVLTRAYNFYDPLVECSTETDPKASSSDLTSWLACLQTIRAEIYPLVSTTLTCRQCLVDFGSFVYNHGSSSCATIGPQDTACQASLAEGLLTVFTCSGVELYSTDPSTCSPVYLSNLDPRFRSYVPMMDMAVQSEGSLPYAVAMFFNQSFNSPLLNVTGYMPCQRCFPILAADLTFAFAHTPEALEACASYYTTNCMETAAVADALTRFESCAGFTLDNSSPYMCSSGEIRSIQIANIPRNLYYGFFNLGPDMVSKDEVVESLQTSFQALVSDAVGASSYMCGKCFDELYKDFTELDTRTTKLCMSEDNIQICFYELKFELDRFKACAGFEFDFSQPPVDQVSMVAPVLNTTENGTDTATELKEGSESQRGSLVCSIDGFFVLMLLIIFT